MPGARLPTSLIHDPGANGANQAAFFCNVYEVSGRNLAAHRVPPAQQGLGAVHHARGRVDLGLIVQFKLVLFECNVQIAFQPDLLLGSRVHVRRKALEIVAAALFREIHGCVCMCQQNLDIRAIARIKCDADAR